MVNSSQSVVNGAAGSGTSSTTASSATTTSTSASVSTGASVAHAIASLAHSGSANPPQPANFGHQYNVLNLQTPLQPTANVDMAGHQQSVNSATNNAAAVLTSVSRVGLPATAGTAPKKRSTKSKCSPGLRSGKWTPEEEAFTNMIIHFFKRGLLDVEDGTSLRWYLAKRLNCEAMRVTKKLKGNSSIGKQIFRAIENTPANRQAIRRAREELGVVEARFLESLSAGGVGPGTQHLSSAQLPSSLAVSVRGRKILPNTSSSQQPMLAPMPVTKPEDARLLLHFFSEAHNSDEEPEDEKKTEKKTDKKTEKKSGKKPEPGSLSIDLSGKLGKKRPLSSVNTNQASTEEAKESATPAHKTTEQLDAASPQSKRQAVKIGNLTE
ncbi:unnamed protein product [Phytophthora fragariaefolia]|uniref:Unnamed protein product n=1 Tax=Phytophthora fragariaefolia TaxID=1490495 RepID=A0A9W6U7W3_9STRA|nr:unnamed protein product [Phytophthora fragariaefolia]